MPDDDATAYSAAQLSAHGRSLARLERAALCDTLEAVGPDQPTLCAGWDTRHLAAHLVLRESTVGEAASPIPKLGDRAVDALAARRDYAGLVAAVRSGPPLLSFFSLPGMDKQMNLLEYYVHHEDARRAGPRWSARPMPGWAEDKIARGLTVVARVSMRRSPVGVEMVRSDTGERLRAISGEPAVSLVGVPSELVLYAFGRDQVADVRIEGDDAAVLAFTEQRFSV